MPHRVSEPMSRQEVRAHKHGEKSRVRANLRALRGEVSADELYDLPEPGRHWKTPHKAWDPEHRTKDNRKHWRTRFWKRRSAVRLDRARQYQAG